MDWIASARGLANIGNSCYFNSLVQSLLSCPAVNQRMDELKDTNPIAAEYNKIFQGSINHVGQLLCSVITTRQNKKDNLHMGWQEDAHEGLMLLMEAINDKVETLFHVKFKTHLVCECGSSRILDQEQTEVSEIFADFYDNDIPLDQYLTRSVQIPTDYKCDKCSERGTTQIIKILDHTSNILVLTFKKYPHKNQINFPNDLTLMIQNKINYYRLVAQIEHYGSMQGGHYIARGLRQDNVYSFNDSHISPDTFTSTPNTYMIFYHKLIPC